VRRQNHIAQPCFNQRGHHTVVASRFGQPQAFGFTSKSIAKVRQSPTNLCFQIAFIAQRQNRMTESLRNRVAVSVLFQCAVAIRLDDARVGISVLLFQPA